MFHPNADCTDVYLVKRDKVEDAVLYTRDGINTKTGTPEVNKEKETWYVTENKQRSPMATIWVEDVVKENANYSKKGNPIDWFGDEYRIFWQVDGNYNEIFLAKIVDIKTIDKSDIKNHYVEERHSCTKMTKCEDLNTLAFSNEQSCNHMGDLGCSWQKKKGLKPAHCSSGQDTGPNRELFEERPLLV
jgi:hypothetical protein